MKAAVVAVVGRLEAEAIRQRVLTEMANAVMMIAVAFMVSLPCCAAAWQASEGARCAGLTA